jgi:hypothetical protein
MPPPKPNPALAGARDHILKSVVAEIRDLEPGLAAQVELVTLSAQLQQLASMLASIPADPADISAIPGIVQRVEDIRLGKSDQSLIGAELVDPYSLQESLDLSIDDLAKAVKPAGSDLDRLAELLLGAIIRTRQLRDARPDVGAIMEDLKAIWRLRGGPADATAFHDFHVLQLAFRSVWMHLFDGRLKTAAARLYEETVRVFDDAGLPAPPWDAIKDAEGLAQREGRELVRAGGVEIRSGLRA